MLINDSLYVLIYNGSMKHHIENDFINLIEAYKAIVYKIANLYAQTTEDREDLFQEIVINLWKAYRSFKGNSKISTWIYQISLNTAITSYRREKKKVKYEPIYNLSLNDLGVHSKDGQLDQLNMLYQAIEELHKIIRPLSCFT